jgi:hypothetical protein
VKGYLSGKRIARQGIGKVRRLMDLAFRKKAVEAGLRLRRGHCRRCGACCRLLVRCPMLGKRKDGSHFCRIYRRRPLSCRLFPLDERCLAERDFELPDLPCGYHFADGGADEPGSHGARK